AERFPAERERGVTNQPRRCAVLERTVETLPNGSGPRETTLDVTNYRICGRLRARLSQDSLKFMLAAGFLTPELFHFHGDARFFRGAIQIGHLFEFVPHLQECGRPAASRASRRLQVHRCLRENQCWAAAKEDVLEAFF